MPAARERDLAHHWTLDPAITFLNHGSFGACPRPVLEVQQALRDQLEREPVLLLHPRGAASCSTRRGRSSRGSSALAAAGLALRAATRPRRQHGAALARARGRATSCSSPTTSTTPRATSSSTPPPSAAPRRGGAGAVPARGARRRCSTRCSRRVTRAHAARADRPRHEPDRRSCSRSPSSCASSTRAASTCSSTARTRRAWSPLDLDALGAGLLHRQLPQVAVRAEGRGFLWVREDRRRDVRPAVISHGANAPRARRARASASSSTGPAPTTRRPRSRVPAALRFLAGLLPGGWPRAARAQPRARARGPRALVADALGVPLPAPDAMIGAMASLSVPALPGVPAPAAAARSSSIRCTTCCSAITRIEVPVLTWPAHPGRLLRISAQAYNTTAGLRAARRRAARDRARRVIDTQGSGFFAASGQSARGGTRSASAGGVKVGSKLHCDGEAPGSARQRASTSPGRRLVRARRAVAVEPVEILLDDRAKLERSEHAVARRAAPDQRVVLAAERRGVVVELLELRRADVVFAPGEGQDRIVHPLGRAAREVDVRCCAHLAATGAGREARHRVVEGLRRFAAEHARVVDALVPAGPAAVQALGVGTKSPIASSEKPRT